MQFYEIIIDSNMTFNILERKKFYWEQMFMTTTTKMRLTCFLCACDNLLLSPSKESP